MAAIIDITATMATATPTYRPMPRRGRRSTTTSSSASSSSPLRRNGDAGRLTTPSSPAPPVNVLANC